MYGRLVVAHLGARLGVLKVSNKARRILQLLCHIVFKQILLAELDDLHLTIGVISLDFRLQKWRVVSFAGHNLKFHIGARDRHSVRVEAGERQRNFCASGHPQ